MGHNKTLYCGGKTHVGNGVRTERLVKLSVGFSVDPESGQLSHQEPSRGNECQTETPPSSCSIA